MCSVEDATAAPEAKEADFDCITTSGKHEAYT